jgi:cell division protein FtsA
MAAGVVLTGGAAKMAGAIELAEEVFHTQVRLGVPQNVSGLADVVRNPVYATGVGLLQFGSKHVPAGGRSLHADGGFASVWERMKHWFQGHF